MSGRTSNSRPICVRGTPSAFRSRINRTASILNSGLNARRSRFALSFLDLVIEHLHPELSRVNEVSTKSGQPQDHRSGSVCSDSRSLDMSILSTP